MKTVNTWIILQSKPILYKNIKSQSDALAIIYSFSGAGLTEAFAFQL
jgi:hypothetical protein